MGKEYEEKIKPEFGKAMATMRDEIEGFLKSLSSSSSSRSHQPQPTEASIVFSHEDRDRVGPGR